MVSLWAAAQACSHWKREPSEPWTGHGPTSSLDLRYLSKGWAGYFMTGGDRFEWPPPFSFPLPHAFPALRAPSTSIMAVRLAHGGLKIAVLNPMLTLFEGHRFVLTSKERTKRNRSVIFPLTFPFPFFLFFLSLKCETFYEIHAPVRCRCRGRARNAAMHHTVITLIR